MKSNKVIGYVRINKKWDTPLDSETVQKKRISKWAKDRMLEIVSWVADDGASGDLLYMAYDDAYEMGGWVLIASACRVADEAEEFLNMFSNSATPLLTTEGLMVTSGFENIYSGIVETLQITQRESYNTLCDEFLTP